MTCMETVQEGVMVYPGALPPIYQEMLADVIDRNGEKFTAEEALVIAMYQVGELATRSEQPERIVA